MAGSDVLNCPLAVAIATSGAVAYSACYIRASGLLPSVAVIAPVAFFHGRPAV
jgi:hypothetical protein